jgi:uncharacterized repeat protein (TIGR02543 family)
VIFGLVRTQLVAARPKRLFKLLLPISIGALVSIVGQTSVAPPASAAIYGTIYNVAPKVSGGSNYGEANCAADQVVVGLLMGWNPIAVGFKCNALNSDLTISPIASKTANYAYCPDGMVAVGMAFINSNGIRAGLICNTPPGLADTDVETKYVSVNNSPVLIDKPAGQAYAGGGVMRCNAGDIMVGWRVWSGAWLDGLAPRCAPFTKFTVTYNVNSGGGTAPATQQQSGPNASITISTYTGTRSGFRLSGWNTQANGLGTDYAAGAMITPTNNLVLYAKWLSTITYNGNTNSGGTVPDPTIAVSSAAVTKLANNTGNLVKTGFTFAGWNTAANGSGTSYSGYGYATPLLRYVASDYNETTKVWANSGSAGSSYNILSINMGSGAGITKVSTTAGVGGSSNSFTTLKGGTTSIIEFPNAAMNNYTLCHVARYAGAAKQRIFTHSSVNWLSGYLSGQSGYYYGVGNSGTVGLQTGDTNWHLICDYNLNFRNNGTAGAAAGRTSLPANIGVATWSTQTSDWEIAEVLFYDVTLGLTQIQQIEASLASTYGLSGYTSTNGTYASTGDITLYAQWNSTITYNGNGQTSASSTVPAATTATGTAANTTLANAGTMLKTGYTFAGWNTQADGLGTNYASGLTTYQSAGNVTLYAKWTRTITYNSNGATSGSPERATDVFVNSTTPTISTFPTVGTMVKTGYTFGGWSTTTSGTALSTPYSTTGEVPLYARWTANTYTIVYDTSTVTSGNMADTSFTAGTAFSLRANAFARTGYTFKNWNTVANGSGTTYTNSQSITLYDSLTLYPQWTLAAPGAPTVSVSAGNTEVTVTPMAAAASGTTVGATTSMLVTAYTNAGAALSPAKTCTVVSPATSCVITGLTNGTAYKFAATATNATSTSASSAQVSGTPAGVIVTFDATTNSGSLPQFSVTNTQVTSQVATLTTNSPHGFTVGTKVVVVCSDTRFAGTYLITAVPSTTTFSYPLSYVNLAFTTVTGTATLATTATYDKGSPLTLPTATKVGYTFSGWYTTASNSPSVGTLIGGAGASYSPANAITLYARFTGIIYTISYNGNGNGTGTVPATGSFETGGTAYAILGGTNSPTKVGYTFAGWNTKADGTGTDYAVNASYSTNANLSLFAKWTAASRTVTYALDGGTSSANTSQLTGKVVGNTVTLPASNTMSKTGYSFAGWSDGTSTYAGGATWTVPASDSNFTLTALWNTQTFTYSYDSNGGGTAPSGGTKTYGESLVLAASTGLSKTGYTFAGWNDGSTTSNAGTSVSITTNKIYVAQWSAQGFTISYSGNTPTSGSVASGSYVAGGVPYAIAANGFTKDGYTFAGWKDASNNSYTVGSGYSTAANLALIAQWTPSSYIVTYNGNGSTGGNAPSSGTLTTGTTFNASDNTGSLIKSGYTFAGWNTSAAGTGTSVAVGGVVTTTSNITLYAKWTIISPLITFNKGIADSITLPGSTSANFGSLFTLPTTDTATVIISGNYAFTGWSDGTNVYQASSTYRMGTANVTFTAQWIAVYTVKYILNGGLVNGSTGTVPNDVLRTDQFDETLSSTIPIKTGYTLSGWKDQSGATIPTGSNAWKISNSSYIAYAQWTPTQRTLSFGLDSGSGSAPADITGKVIGEIVTLPTTSSTKTGYTFGGWSNNGVTYPAGGTFTVGDGNAAFVAVWISNSNIITYNGNGATGGTVPANGSFTTGSVSPFTVSTNTGNLVKDGFTFDGWYTTPTGTGGTGYAVSPAGTFVTNTNVTLYAKWNAASYTITYNTDGGSTAPSQTTNAYGSTVTLPSAPTKAGSNFLGWETGTGASANLYAPGSSYVMGSSAVTFIARWSGISYAVTYALNGGAGTAPTQANVSSGGSFTTAATPTKTGFTFTGWSDGATTTNASTLITNVSGNITLTAQWTISAPGIPGTPTATPGNGSATIIIAAPTSGGTPSSYTVTASPGGATCTIVSPGTSCTIAPLTNGTAYTFTSTATNTAGSSASASTSSAAVTPAGVPTAPSGVSGTGTGGTINIAWTVPSSDGGSAITDYIVEYSVDGSGTWATFADGTSTTTSATVTGLIAGNAYEFRVTAKNIIGNSLPSFSSPTIETLPTAPTITGVTSGSEQVTVTWTAPSHLGSGTITGDQYVVKAYDAAGNEAGSCKPTSGQTTCVVTDLDNGSAYTFKVAVITTVGTSAQSAASATAIPAGVPSAPANVVAVTTGSNMRISFDASADNGGSAITSYVITSSPAGATCTVGANATTYTCTGLTAGTNYTYTVKAVNSKGQSSASLASTAVTAVAAPSAPQSVSAVITAGTTTLSATVSFNPPSTDNGSPVTSYRVTASPGGATCTVTAPTTYCDIPVLPDRVYTFTVTATNAVGTSVSSSASLETKAVNGIAPTLVVDPIPAPTGELVENKVLSSNITFADFNSTPNSVVTYQWKRCTDPLDDTTCTNISGATSATYTLGSGDVDKYIRVAVTATNSIGTVTKLSEATEIIVAAPVAPTPSSPSTPSAPSTPVIDPTPSAPICDSACQAIKDAAAAKAIADAAAKAAADKLAADAAAKLKADAAATTASTKAAADAAAAAAAAKAAIDKAAAAAVAQATADAAAKVAAAQAKAAADAQAAAAKAAADAAAALKNSTATAAAKAAATASANKAAADAAAAVKAAATAAQQAAQAKTTASNASKQVDIAINTLNSKTATSQASAQANAVAAAAKAAANEAAAAAATKASEAKATATAAQKAASDTAARIATEQKQAADAAALAKAAADAAAKATAEKVAAVAAATKAAQDLAKVLADKATLAEQAAKATDETARAEIQKKIEEVTTKVEEVQKSVDVATTKADAAVAVQVNAVQNAETATKEAQTQAAEAVAVKAESVAKTAEATKAVAAASVAAKVATAAKEAAAKVPSKAVITTKPSTSTSKNSATATITGLKPGQSVKVTVNTKDK